jgi:hypothetical protein
MNNFPTARDLADAARQALKDSRMNPQEHIEFLVEQGIIDRCGRVLVAKLFGVETPSNGTPPASGADKNGFPPF